MLANNSNNGYLSPWLASRQLGYIHGLQSCPSSVAVDGDVTFNTQQHLITFNRKNYTRNELWTAVGRRDPPVGNITIPVRDG